MANHYSEDLIYEKFIFLEFFLESSSSTGKESYSARYGSLTPSS